MARAPAAHHFGAFSPTRSFGTGSRTTSSRRAIPSCYWPRPFRCASPPTPQYSDTGVLVGGLEGLPRQRLHTGTHGYPSTTGAGAISSRWSSTSHSTRSRVKLGGQLSIRILEYTELLGLVGSSPKTLHFRLVAPLNGNQGGVRTRIGDRPRKLKGLTTLSVQLEITLSKCVSALRLTRISSFALAVVPYLCPRAAPVPSLMRPELNHARSAPDDAIVQLLRSRATLGRDTSTRQADPPRHNR